MSKKAMQRVTEYMIDSECCASHSVTLSLCRDRPNRESLAQEEES